MIVLLRYICVLLLFPILAIGQGKEKIVCWTDKENYHVGESVWFTLHLRDAVDSEKLSASKTAYVELMRTGDTAVLQLKILIDSGVGNGRFIIPPSLTSGIYTIRAYTNWMKNFNPQFFAYRQINIFNVLQTKTSPIPYKKDILPVKDLDINLRTNKIKYSSREKVILELKNQFEDASLLSVSVFRLNAPYSKEQVVNDPNETNKLSNQNFNVKNIGAISYWPELYGHIVTGTVKDRRTGLPASEVNCYMTIIGKTNTFYAAASDTSGKLFFEVNNVFDVNKAILQTRDSNHIISLDKSFINVQHSPPTGIDTVAIDSVDWLTDAAVSAQVQLLYNYQEQDYPVPIDTMRFYGFPEYSYVVDDYVKFSTLEEIFREYIRPVQMFKRDKLVVPYIFYAAQRRVFANQPFVLIDNVPILHMKQFMDINTARIERIDVSDKAYYFHHEVFDGIISITTKTKYPEDYLGKNAIIEHFAGWQSPQLYNAPVYENEEQKNGRIPDFRNLLFWSPAINLQTEKQITFYTSDLSGEYMVLVKGINQTGEVAGKMTIFEVE